MAAPVSKIQRLRGTEKPQQDFVSVLRELVRAMEDLAALRARSDANGLVDEWLKKLVAALGEVREEAQKAAIEALIDFVSSDLIDFLETGVYQARRWVEVRRVVEGGVAGGWSSLVPSRLFALGLGVARLCRRRP